MKAILVIDKLENCSKCPCHNGEWGYCQADKKERQIHHEDFPSWCPLKPFPQKAEIKSTDSDGMKHYKQGINDTISRINGTLIQSFCED